jgi:hypothetical protein
LPVSLTYLVKASTAILVAVPRAAASRWEEQGGSRRIVTVSEVEILQILDGREPSDSRLFVQTLGGRVGNVGQLVHGEAELDRDKPQLMFLRPSEGFGNSAGRLRLTGLAQGHYPIVDDDSGTPRLRLSPRLSDFVKPDPFSAVARLRGQTLSRCEALIAEELKYGR